MFKKHLKTLGVVMAVGLGALVMSNAGAADVSGEAARALVEKQGALLLDVRTPEEFASGHVEGAKNIPVQELEAKLASVPAKKDQDVVVYCRSGGRSAKAKAILKNAGFQKVHDLGGMANWK